MPSAPSILTPYPDSEVVFGLVAPIGTDLARFEALLESYLAEYRYNVRRVSLSEIALHLAREKPGEGEGERASELMSRKMNAGNAVRARRTDGLVFGAAATISGGREHTDHVAHPLLRVAHVLRSLKHPEEVQALRRIYGAGFFLIGVVTTNAERNEYLEKRKGCTRDEREKLQLRDDHEDLPHGQRTRDTFHLADVFITLNGSEELRRFLDLIFGHPHITPTADEHAMFLAFSAALRSGDLSRQVGAVLVSAKGDLVATGANDVPVQGGGLHWPGPRDARDFVKKRDYNESERAEIIADVLTRLQPKELAGADAESWQATSKAALRGALIFDITEYGRPVHAEMDALLAAGRAAVSARGATLYCTTFPCHNCAKHIIAAGVSRVVYVEPYPKSRTRQLYGEAVRFEPADAHDDRVLFEPFTGIGPRRFFDLFSMTLSSGYSVKRKANDGAGSARNDWTPAISEARVPLQPTTYLLHESWAAAEIENWFESDEEGAADEA